jgi:hypothetical protein
MTAAATPGTATSARTGHERLRTLFRIDAATCAATALVAITAAAPVADLLGVDSHAWVRGVGAFLVVYSVSLWSLTRAPRATAVLGAAATAAGDGLWVAVTVVLAMAGAFSGVGTAVMGAVGVVVAALGIAKVEAIRR